MGQKKIHESPFSAEELHREFEEASRLGREALRREPRAKHVFYDDSNGRLILELLDGRLIGIPIGQIQGLSAEPPEKIAEFELSPLGDALVWDRLDLEFGIEGLVNGVFGTRAWMAELGRRGGSVSTEAKAAAARENGSKGGRPRKALAASANALSAFNTLIVRAATEPVADDAVIPVYVSGTSHQETADLARYERDLISTYHATNVASSNVTLSQLPNQEVNYAQSAITTSTGQKIKEATSNAELALAA